MKKSNKISLLALEVETDLKFWNLTPTMSLNNHAKELEICWLCWGLYVSSPLMRYRKLISDYELCVKKSTQKTTEQSRTFDNMGRHHKIIKK